MRISDWSSDVCSSDLKEIEKGAKSLAKKLSKELKIDEAAILKVSSVPAKPAKKTATATRTRKLAATKAAASAAPKATAKPVTVARTRKPAAAKVAATSADRKSTRLNSSH